MNYSTRWARAHAGEPEVVAAQKAASRRYYEKNRERLTALRMVRHWDQKIAAMTAAQEKMENKSPE
jgi:hypothetical protein